MAIDTENKRRSVINTLLPFLMMPEADGTVDEGDRQPLAGAYSGLDLQEIPIPLRDGQIRRKK